MAKWSISVLLMICTLRSFIVTATSKLLSFFAFELRLFLRSQFVSPIKIISLRSLCKFFKTSLRFSNATSSAFEGLFLFLCCSGLHFRFSLL